MENKLITGIVDSPLQQGEADKLQMESFEMALTEFVKKTSTPISIALQGEWGSGKTSLMNRLEAKLCQQEDAPFYSVWLNTWHYALTGEKRSMMFEIVDYLISEVLEISKKEHPEKLKYLINDVYKIGKDVLKGVSKIAVKTATSKVNEDMSDAVDEVFFSGSGNKKNISELRNRLENLISELIAKNNEQNIAKHSFVFFIDDLDRIEPAVAVNILELLKNIFDIEHCIFILAIDYDVVVKGLKGKFGDLDQTNEREFRSFFDKIIQLPFQMPVKTYIIDDYIKDMLISVGFIDKKQADNDFIRTLVQFANLSVGSNPRSIKRLTNTLSFINLLIQSKNSLSGYDDSLELSEKQIIFALTCLQSAFPAVFNLLADNPHIENWSDEFAKKHEIKVRTSLNKANTDYFLDTRWKEILHVYCNNTPFLRRNFFNIIRIISEIQLIAEHDGKTLNQVLPNSIDLLSVTNIKSDTKPRIDINNIRVLYALNQKLEPALLKKIEPPLNQVKRKGRMIAKLSYLFDKDDRDKWISIYVFVQYNNLYLKVGNAIELFPVESNETVPLECIEKMGKTETFNQLAADFQNLNQKYINFSLLHKPKNSLKINRQKLLLEQYFQLVTENVEYLYTDKNIEELASFIIDYMELTHKIITINWKSM